MSETTKIKSYVPSTDDTYEPWGNYNTILKIIKSKLFYPVYITGLSGNGKTLSILQACAKEQRECIRVNITTETDEDDLLGGWRLVNGDTVWQDGPVIEAMRRGAVLLLDEIDLASHKIMCLQPILEGRGVYLKKVNEQVSHTPGFTVFATANTKGKGSEDGNFIGTNILNEAFLDRFPATLYQDYPPYEIEEKILTKSLDKAGKELNIQDSDFGEKEVQQLLGFISNSLRWAERVRQSYKEGVDGLESVITTRRLVDFGRSYLIFRDVDVALDMILERFDEETKAAFKEFYKLSYKSTPKGEK